MLKSELYPQLNEQRGGKGAVPVTNIGAVPVTNIDFFSRKSSLPTGSVGTTVVRISGTSHITGKSIFKCKMFRNWLHFKLINIMHWFQN